MLIIFISSGSGDSRSEEEEERYSADPESQESGESGEEDETEDAHGLQLSKEEMLGAMEDAKRIDNKEPNMTLNPALVASLHMGLLGGGAWSTKARKAVKEKYFLSEGQFRKTGAPTLRGTKLNMAIEDMGFGGLS